ncbi:MAG: hypothetical protein JO107_08780 [Hyphomicrobiales bacterium]|nr:hypothetical protein [Hyphomicrobiales bacterium]MBV8663184.1 hypothetical protein [Hyphomicrobiales bacterium]
MSRAARDGGNRDGFTRAVAAGLIAVAVALPPPAFAGSATAHYEKPATPDLNANGTTPDRIVKAGQETNVAIVWDCAWPNYAPVVSARVKHGTVAIVTGNGPNCGHPLMSQTRIVYRSVPGFHGTDTLTVLAFLTSGDMTQTFTILVK